MKTGELIKELRIEKGMTQEGLAEMTELSTRTIQRIEKGEVDPRAYTLQMIAQALDVDFSIFMDKGFNENTETNKAKKSYSLAFLHLSGLIPLIFPIILVWRHLKQTDKGATDHFKVALSFQLLIFGVLCGCLWVYWRSNVLEPLIGVLLVNALLVIMNALQVLNGKGYFYPIVNKKSKQKEV